MNYKQEYAQKLKDPRWQRKRLEILNRDNFTCRVCENKEQTLHVHHEEYRWGADPWDYPNDQLTTLCVDCHELQTQFDKDIKESRSALLESFRQCSFYIQLSAGTVITPEALENTIKELLAKRTTKK